MIGALLWRFRGPLILAVAVLASITSVSLAFKAGEARRGQAVAERRADILDRELNAPETGVRAQLTACRLDRDDFKGKLDKQNERVDALKAEADARDARAREAVSAAQNRARTAERRVQALLQSSPNEGETPCVAAERLIREELR